MERRLKERLIGASVLVLLAVIFIPMALDDSQESDPAITKTNIPEKPSGEFSSRLIPLPEPEDIIPPEPERETEPVMTSMEDTGAQAQSPQAENHPEPAALSQISGQEPGQGAGQEPGRAVPAAESSPAVPDAAPKATPEAAPAVATGDTKTVEPVPDPSNDSSNDKKGLTAWVVQVGSFASEENANKLNEKLRTAGYRSFIQTKKRGNSLSYRVRVGPEILRSEALKQKSRLKERMKLEGIVLDYP